MKALSPPQMSNLCSVLRLWVAKKLLEGWKGHVEAFKQGRKRFEQDIANLEKDHPFHDH
jgi:hypothetical protein